MTSDTSSFETPEQDDLGYRDTHLGVAGIFINEYTVEQLPVGLRRMILDMTRYDGNIPEDSETVRTCSVSAAYCDIENETR